MDFVLFDGSLCRYNTLNDTIRRLLWRIISAPLSPPRVRGDGGWVEFVSYENRCLTLLFRGECSKCIILDRCLDWIRQEIQRDLKEDVTIKAIPRKPFFWDT